MPTKLQTVTGLGCPRCGGIVPVPEGQAIVACPYCDQRSVVSAEQQGDLDTGAADFGVRRYQAPLQVTREQAVDQLKRFLSGKVQVARDAAAQAQLKDAFLVHLPFWGVWGRGVAWAFGQVQVGSGDNKRYEPREKKVARELVWNCPACEVGEFGVNQIPLEGCAMEPFNADLLHRSGMVFEPVGSAQQALEAAEQEFGETIRGEVKLERTAQLFAKVVRPKMGLVYYPLWVLRYHYHGRAFQIVVDGVRGDVLYGKAPGSVAYRAAMLVGGMAFGAAVTIDIPALIMWFTSDSKSSDGGDKAIVVAGIVFLFGLGILYNAFRTFRYAEQYEYHRFRKAKTNPLSSANLAGQLPGGINKAINVLEKFS